MTYLDRSTTNVFSSREKVHRNKIVSIKKNADGCVWFKQNAGESGWQLSMGMKVQKWGWLGISFCHYTHGNSRQNKASPQEKYHFIVSTADAQNINGKDIEPLWKPSLFFLILVHALLFENTFP